jgi:protein involved in sex pheromone biosynthesis
MNVFCSRTLAILGSAMVFCLSACASNDGSLQSRIENKVNTPASDNVQIGSSNYNAFSKDFDKPWPFGPYSD